MISARRKFGLLLIAIFILRFATPGIAHEIRPGLLDISERSPGLFYVTWKVPMRGDMILAIEPTLPSSFKLVAPPSEKFVPGARVQHLIYQSEEASLTGEEIGVSGLSSLQIDVLLRIELANGQAHSAILRPSSPTFVVPMQASKYEVAKSYSQMGFTHILEGVDHLLFLFALLLLIVDFKMLVKTVTAFTVAHSVTLCAATLGIVQVPSSPTEAVIALSIVFLAAEIVRHRAGENVLSAKYPWIVAGFFGLFHGLGFAGALSEVGVPSHEVPLALLMFNIGVEGGQLLFVTAAFGVLVFMKRVSLPEILRSRPYVPYAIGSVAAYWAIERTLKAFQFVV